MGPSSVSRRTALGVALAVGVAGCGRTEWYPSDVTPEEYVLRAMIREKERTVARYEAALADGAGPEELLTRILEHHLSHIDALTEALPESPAAGDPQTPLAEIPAPDAVLDTAELSALESAAASARVDRALAVADPGLAQLISGIGACEAGHAHLLDRADGEDGRG
ncbi:ferritin-like domain-containing protein [Nocardiopsis sp. FIRDI 009]|uniref:ferritin-like domain-containing protein n=1 Tax=Nocardiopsis sp. FIRDI 009 TaxID=714197 RepID=UPI000E250E94|nr:ferritin-like domain-containing protein [Nocardiopsis sp. FIRDI 009]